jgi:hypothetical protein
MKAYEVIKIEKAIRYIADAIFFLGIMVAANSCVMLIK